MTTIGIDPARHTGYAVVEGDTVIESGVWDIAGDRWTTTVSGYHAASIELNSRLVRLAARHTYAPIVCEDPTTRHAGIAKAYGALMTGVLQATVFTNHKLEFVRPTVWKKRLWDKGNATKTISIETAAKLLGRDPVDDNEADAICIAMYGEYERGER